MEHTDQSVHNAIPLAALRPANASREVSAYREETRARWFHWCLRVGAGACFIGHGAFGIITKAAWLPYFAVAGIGPENAYALMPVVGSVDILMGVAVLLSPRPFILLYMAVWALWTALLRPITGEPVFEMMERAGNYGVPLAMLLLIGVPSGWRAWFTGVDRATPSMPSIAWVLRCTTALLLFGHGALQAFTRKPMFATHYASLGMPASISPILGWIEMSAALAVLIAPVPALLIAIAIWKIATEALFPVSGAPIWEFIERGGSYAAPLALAILTMGRSRSHITRGRTT